MDSRFDLQVRNVFEQAIRHNNFSAEVFAWTRDYYDCGWEDAARATTYAAEKLLKLETAQPI